MSRVVNERYSELIPVVRCSDCGREVQVRQLGKHICSRAPALPDKIPFLPLEKPNQSPPKVALPVSPRSPDGYYRAPPSSSPYDRQQQQQPNYNTRQAPPPQHPHHPPQQQHAPRYQQQPQHHHQHHHQQQQQQSRYHDDSRQHQHLRADYPHSPPRKNSKSPAPPDLSSPTSPNYSLGSSTDELSNYNNHNYSQSSLYPRNDSLHNIHAPKNDHAPKNNHSLDALMDDLMHSMNDITDTVGAESCSLCKQEFDYRDDVVHADEKCYHQSCFSCHLCRAPLRPQQYFEWDRQLYCERDYNVVKRRVICAACDRPITSNITPIKALGRTYHPGHIKCYRCYCPLTEKTGAKERQQRVYCRKDYKDLFLPKCRACNLPVEKEAVSAVDGKLQGKWHLKCFGCHTCHEPFPDNTFYVYENLPYCRRHYHQLNNSLCRACDEPIEGPCAQTIEGWRFHPPCFTCSVCKSLMTDVYYMYERRIYCETHIVQLQKQRNFRAEKRRTQFGRI